MKTKKLRTKEQHELMRMVKRFQEKQLPTSENSLRDRERNKKITINVEVDEAE